MLAIRLILGRVLDGFNIYIAMCLSGWLMHNTVFGGALYLVGRIWITYASLYGKDSYEFLPNRIQVQGKIIFVFAVLFTFALSVIYPVIQSFRGFFLLLIFVLAQLTLRQLVEPHPPKTGDTLANMLEVSSYRLYIRMLSNASIAINIVVLSYVCYIRFHPARGLGQNILLFLLWGIGILVVTLLVWRILNRKVLHKYEKPSIFIFGTMLWCIASIGSYNHVFSSALIPGTLWCIGLGLMVAIIISIGQDIQTIMAFAMGDIKQLLYWRSTDIMVQWSIMVSNLVMLLMLTVLSFLAVGLTSMEAQLGIQNLFNLVMLLLPIGFVLAALIFALVQPLDRHYMEKFTLYQKLKAKGREDSVIRTSLNDRLVKGTKRIGIRILRTFLKPLFPCHIHGKQIVDTSQGAVIFVCNHLEVYGPVLTTLHMPFYFRPWVNSQVLNEASLEMELQAGVDRLVGFLPFWLRHRIPHWIKGLFLFVMRSVEPIPVYRNNLREVMTTLKQTAKVLEEDDNVLIFPENPIQGEEGGQYPEEGVASFFTGFVHIGTEYYKNTGRTITFYPMYVCKKNRTITFDFGVTYNPKAPRSKEKERIVSYLYDRMQRMAEAQECD